MAFAFNKMFYKSSVSGDRRAMKVTWIEKNTKLSEHTRSLVMMFD